ncbi:MAG: xanthine dehydrogenase family protein subunit M [Deltaproteobacteria bacterium]|nr:xanthine dehydrogenase family protein subunit M [Deltaproteobacteria bacterium]
MLIGLPEFDYLACDTLEHAFELLDRYAGVSRILAGGTDLFVKMKHRRLMPRYLIDIKKIPDLKGIHYDEHTGLRIGALTSIEEIKNSTRVKKHAPILSEAAGKLGTTHIRNLGTLGGNLAHASPAAEFAPPLLTLNAIAKIIGAGGERTISLTDFFVGPGQSTIQADEILAEIIMPNLPVTEGIHLKYSTRPMDVAIVNLAVMATIKGEACEEIAIALGAVGPTPFRAGKAERVMRGRRLGGDLQDLFEETAEKAVEESQPIDDFRASAAHRNKMIKELTTEGLRQIIERKVTKV